jgi:tetratricopeptide (TPR) repeat protein
MKTVEATSIMTKKRPKTDLNSTPSPPGKTEISRNSPHRLFGRHALILLLLTSIVFLIYSNIFKSPFLFDDVTNIQQNPQIRLTEINLKNLRRIMVEGPSANRPVAVLTFALNYYFNEYHVGGYHLVNIVIHIITGLLLYFLLRTMMRIPSIGFTKKHHEWVPFFAVLIWLVHPIQTQSVTYIVQRMNSLATMFYILSLLLYVQARLATEKRKIQLLFSGCIIAGILSIGSKEIAATLPFFIFLFEWYFFQDLKKDWLKHRALPFSGLLILLVIISMIFLGSHPLEKILNGYRGFDFTLTQRLLTEFRVVVYYISLLVFPRPSRLNLDHDFTLSQSLTDPVTTLLSVLTIVGLLGVAVYMAKRQPLLSFCILWFLGNLVIESSVIALDLIFEHRTYLPSMMAILFGVILVYRFGGPNWVKVCAFCSIVLVFSYWTYERNNTWRDEITIWRDCVVKSPQKARPHYNLGTSLSLKGHTPEAIQQYFEALRLKPDYAEAHSNLGVDLLSQGQTGEAIRHYREALRIKPDYAKAQYNLGYALLQLSDYNKAIRHFKEAVRIDPDYAKAHHNLGMALVKQSKYEEAILHFKEALRVNPEDVRSHNNLGAALYRQGRFEEAIHHYREALELQPDFEEAQINLGIALEKSGNPDKAISHYSELLRTDPDLAEVHYKLGALLYTLGRIEEAIGHYTEAIRIKPDFAEAHYNLGTVYHGQGRIKEAVFHYSEAVRIKPDFAEAHNNLGIALSKEGQNRMAIDHYIEALRIQPDYAEAHNNLGVALAKIGKIKEATKQFSEAVRFRPDYEEANGNLKRALVLLDKSDKVNEEIKESSTY